MRLGCIFRKHRYGLPRTSGDGIVLMECMNCLHVARSSLVLPANYDKGTELGSRRASAIAGLVARNPRVGLVANPPDTSVASVITEAVVAPRPRPA